MIGPLDFCFIENTVPDKQKEPDKFSKDYAARDFLLFDLEYSGL
jgi:hypothetical protein